MKLESMLVPLEIHGAAAAMAPVVQEIARLGIGKAFLLYVMHIRETAGDPAILAHDREVMKKWKECLEACGVSEVEAEVVPGIPWIEILERDDALHPSLIVMGSHGRSLIAKMFLGSTTENVLHHAKAPVLILRLNILKEGDPKACTLRTGIFRRVLYLTDFSAEAERCIPFIEWIASAMPESLVVMHVQDTRRLSLVSQEQIAEFNRKDALRLNDLRKRFESLGIPQVATVLVTGNAIEEILAIEETLEPTLIVMGAKGRTSPARVLLGGVTEAIVHHARAHVLVVR